jgi:hypothetical protein
MPGTKGKNPSLDDLAGCEEKAPMVDHEGPRKAMILNAYVCASLKA